MTENPQMPPTETPVAVSQSALNYVVVAVVFFVLGALLGSFVFPSSSTSETTATLPDDFDERVRLALEETLIENGLMPEPGLVMGERYDIAPEDADPYWGVDDATVTIIEFSDFTCGFCGRFATQTLPILEEEYSDKVKFIYMDFPVITANSRPAAMAAECADDQGEFWAYHDALFSSDDKTTEGFISLAEELALDVDTFTACLENEDHAEEINEDMAYGRDLGVSGTPAFFINGIFVSGAQPIEVFRTVIDGELEAAAN